MQNVRLLHLYVVRILNRIVLRNSVTIIISDSGRLEVHDYVINMYETWLIKTECDYGIHIVSLHFDIEAFYDQLAIDDQVYSGTVEIDQKIMSNNITVAFFSDNFVVTDGFVLSWSCMKGKGLSLLFNNLTARLYIYIQSTKDIGQIGRNGVLARLWMVRVGQFLDQGFVGYKIEINIAQAMILNSNNVLPHQIAVC